MMLFIIEILMDRKDQCNLEFFLCSFIFKDQCCFIFKEVSKKNITILFTNSNLNIYFNNNNNYSDSYVVFIFHFQ